MLSASAFWLQVIAPRGQTMLQSPLEHVWVQLVELQIIALHVPEVQSCLQFPIFDPAFEQVILHRPPMRHRWSHSSLSQCIVALLRASTNWSQLPSPVGHTIRHSYASRWCPQVCWQAFASHSIVFAVICVHLSTAWEHFMLVQTAGLQCWSHFLELQVIRSQKKVSKQFWSHLTKERHSISWHRLSWHSCLQLSYGAFRPQYMEPIWFELKMSCSHDRLFDMESQLVLFIAEVSVGPHAQTKATASRNIVIEGYGWCSIS